MTRYAPLTAEHVTTRRLRALKKEGEHVVAELERFNREYPVHEVIGRSPSGRAGQPTARAGSRLVDTVTIAIAALIAAYFLAQMVRAVLS